MTSDHGCIRLQLQRCMPSRLRVTMPEKNAWHKCSLLYDVQVPGAPNLSGLAPCCCTAGPHSTPSGRRLRGT